MMIICGCCPVTAQSGTETDTLARKVPKPRPMLSFDNRRSFLLNRGVRIAGIKMGMEFEGRWRGGFGLYWLRSPIDELRIVDSGPDAGDTVLARIRFAYIGPYSEVLLFNNKKWEFSAPFTIGFGNSRLEYTDPAGIVRVLREVTVPLITLNFTGHYKIFSWLGLGAGIGYRKTISGNPIVEDNFDAPFGILKLKLFLGPIYRAVFPKK